MKLRTRILTIAGQSWPVRRWASSRCATFGVTVRKYQGAIELRHQTRVIRLAPKHIFLAPQVASAFQSFALGLQSTDRDGVSVTDFAAHPDTFNMCRTCVAMGATLEDRGTGIWVRKGNRAMVLAPKHLIYARDMVEKFDLYFSPLVPQSIDGVDVLDYSRPGQLQTYKSGLQFEMASFPEEEEAIEEYFRWYRPQPGDLVFDIGAHCGVSTYHLSQLVGPSGKVVAFEPDPVNCSLLERNIERHRLSNVIVANAAISGRSGKLQFNSEGTIGSSLVSLLQRDSVGTIVTVDAMTLADAFARWGVPAFCKIDIEGAEIDVVASSADLIRKHPTHFALDTNHPQPNGRMTDHEVERLFRSYGYDAVSEASPLLTTWARPRP